MLNFTISGYFEAQFRAKESQMTPILKRDEADELRLEILRDLPNAQQWLNTPHPLLGGVTPEQKIQAGELEKVQDLLYSILYVGIS